MESIKEFVDELIEAIINIYHELVDFIEDIRNF